MNLELEDLLKKDGPACLVVCANLKPVAGMDRFQPAGFPEVGHVLYDAPRKGGRAEKVCIVDSPASMANHLESVCMDGAGGTALHPDLEGLPYVACVTDRNIRMEDGKLAIEKGPQDRVIALSLTEGHRIASDYFLDGAIDGSRFRDVLRREFGLIEIKKDKTYFVTPESWWDIYRSVFKRDPNSLVHGVLFAKEQIKISRLLTAHLEAHGAARVGRSGVKFDRLGKTTSGQPIFSVDEETASEIRATFIIDLAMLRSYGRDNLGLKTPEKRLLLELALWKIEKLVGAAFRYRTGCHLVRESIQFKNEAGAELGSDFPKLDLRACIQKCQFDRPVTQVYYNALELFKAKDDKTSAAEARDDSDDSSDGPNDD